MTMKMNARLFDQKWKKARQKAAGQEKSTG
jgi:hypothetical protein